MTLALIVLAVGCQGSGPGNDDQGEAVAVVSATPARGWYPLTVSLDGSGSEGATSFGWDLDGDGVADSSEVAFEHGFEEPGSWPVTLAVSDAQGLEDSATITIEVLDDELERLFEEDFDSSPFSDGRWTVWLSDCSTTRDGTVSYETDDDGCGGVGGYITRDGTERCVEYTGSAFDTAGYHELSLEHWIDTGGGSVTVEGLVDGGWEVLDTLDGGVDGWQQRQVALSGSVTGLRVRLQDDGAVDCLSIQGVPMSRPTEARACAGGDVLISASAVPGEDHQWSLDGQPLDQGDHAQLWLEGVDEGDEGAYRCTIESGGESLVSNESVLAIEEAPGISAQPASQEVTAGRAATFEVGATGAGALSYQWQRDGVEIDGATDATLVLDTVGSSDEGAYACVVSDDCGSVGSEPATLVVRYWDDEVDLVEGTAVQVDLHYESPWIIEADLLGCQGSGRFDRYLQEEDRLDLFNRGEDNLALRLANRQIWFESANVGEVSTEIGETDHFGVTETANVESGDHQLRIEYMPEDERARLYWDGALIGDWNLWFESVPGAMGQVEVSHLEGGSLRWYQGEFESSTPLFDPAPRR